MRSTVAGLTAFGVFMALSWLAKTFFADTMVADGLGRDVIATFVVGGMLATFVAVYLRYPTRLFRSRHRRRYLPKKQRFHK